MVAERDHSKCLNPLPFLRRPSPRLVEEEECGVVTGNAGGKYRVAEGTICHSGGPGGPWHPGSYQLQVVRETCSCPLGTVQPPYLP